MRVVLACLFAVFAISSCAFAGEGSEEAASSMKMASSVVGRDLHSFYTDAGTYKSLALGLVAAAPLANTDADAEASSYFEENLRSTSTDSVSDVFRHLGNGFLTAPALLVASMAAGPDISGWATDSLRAMIVGAPAGLFLQYATGGSRPTEGGSKWRPLNDNNGLSGHSFMGSVPFIVAAKRSEGAGAKALFYALSALPAASRINDRRHYLSQAILGWHLGYLAASHVERRKDAASGTDVTLSPFGPDGFMVVVKMEY